MLYGKNYFLSANTSKGFVDFFKDAQSHCERAYILKGCTGNGKSTLIEKVATLAFADGYDVERVHCSLNTSNLDGVIIPNLGVGLFDGSEPHITEARVQGMRDTLIDLGEYIDTDGVCDKLELAEKLIGSINLSYKSLYSNYAKAKEIHDDWERLYLENISFEALDELTQIVTDKMIGDNYAEKDAKVYKRFFGASTPSSSINFIKNLTDGLKTRYFIKGRPGSGKSTMMKKIAAEANLRGFDTEQYYCSFDANSLDMVVIRELGVCIFDSTQPHELFPSRMGDEIVDVYACAIEKGTDEKFAIELTKIKSLYGAYIRSGKLNLKQAINLTAELESIYRPYIDFEKIENLAEKLYGKIKK